MNSSTFLPIKVKVFFLFLWINLAVEVNSAQYGESCISDEDCTVESNLICNINGKCGCYQEELKKTFYSFPDSKCYVYVLQICLEENDMSRECAPRSICDELNTRKCLCSSPLLLPNINYTDCSLPFESDCILLDDLCDESRYFSCTTNENYPICQCSNFDIAWYDNATNICKLREGASCDSTKQPCITNALCDVEISKTCQCDSTIHENLEPNEQHLCYIPHNRNCVVEDLLSNLCDPTKYLVCDWENGMCECDHEDSWYDKEMSTCKLLANSDCDSNYAENKAQECIKFSNCNPNTRKCECFPGLDANKHGHCYISHGGKCGIGGVEGYCDPASFLTCDNNTHNCVCGGSSETWYDSTSKTCFILANGSCNNTNQQCLPNAECNPETKLCTCIDETIANKERKCRLNYGYKCDEKIDLCDPLKYLECSKENLSLENETGAVCNCKDSKNSWFDSDAGECHILANSPCSIDFQAQSCVKNSECILGTGDSPFRCTCEIGYDMNYLGLCYLGYETQCQAENDNCDPALFLSCHDTLNICRCSNNEAKFINGTCRLLPGSECELNVDSVSCVSNSECVLEECTCKTEYEASTTGVCLKSYGKPCDNVYDPCNHENSLECLSDRCICKLGYLEYSPEGTNVLCLPGFKEQCNETNICNPNSLLRCVVNQCDCSLPAEQIYDNKRNKCVSILNSRCDLNDSTQIPNNPVLSCIDNAICAPNSDNTGESYGKCTCKPGSFGLSTTVCSSACLISSNHLGTNDIFVLFVLGYILKQTIV